MTYKHKQSIKSDKPFYVALICFLIGAVIGLLIPVIGDFIVHGTVFPCHTVKEYEDGSSVQHCGSRE